MNKTEFFIMNFYKTIKLLDASLLSIPTVSEQINIRIHYWRHSSAIGSLDDEYCVFIDNRENERAQWQEFGHEMYHYFFDDTSYNQLKEDYGTYGESKADYFAYHFCVPTFMLQNLKGVNAHDIATLFNVEFSFALKRAEMYKNSIMGGKVLWRKDMPGIVAETSGSWK